MSMSGIEIDADVAPLFNDMKLKSVHKYATFNITDKKTKVSIEFKGDPAITEDKEADKACFNKLCERLTKRPTYILYDFGFKMQDGRILKKLAFIFWCPDDCKVGDKMTYASTKDAVKKAFTGIGTEFQANDAGDMDYDAFSAEMERKA